LIWVSGAEVEIPVLGIAKWPQLALLAIQVNNVLKVAVNNSNSSSVWWFENAIAFQVLTKCTSFGRSGIFPRKPLYERWTRHPSRLGYASKLKYRRCQRCLICSDANLATQLLAGRANDQRYMYDRACQIRPPVLVNTAFEAFAMIRRDNHGGVV